jgi:tetrahydromethanopterin S-methyltransferase, subunit C (EC 2.1.1.86)
MTVKAEVGAGAIPHNTILGIGLVGALVGIYLTYLNVLLNTQVFAFFGGLGAVWHSSGVRTPSRHCAAMVSEPGFPRPV